MEYAYSTTFKQQNSHLTHVEVDEVFGLVSHVGAEIPTHYGVPSGIVLLVEFLLNEGLFLNTHHDTAMSFSMLNFSSAWLAQSMASCCISSLMSAFFTTAFLSAWAIIFYKFKLFQLYEKCSKIS